MSSVFLGFGFGFGTGLDFFERGDNLAGISCGCEEVKGVKSPFAFCTTTIISCSLY